MPLIVLSCHLLTSPFVKVHPFSLSYIANKCTVNPIKLRPTIIPKAQMTIFALSSFHSRLPSLYITPAIVAQLNRRNQDANHHWSSGTRSQPRNCCMHGRESALSSSFIIIITIEGYRPIELCWSSRAQTPLRTVNDLRLSLWNCSSAFAVEMYCFFSTLRRAVLGAIRFSFPNTLFLIDTE